MFTRKNHLGPPATTIIQYIQYILLLFLLGFLCCCYVVIRGKLIITLIQRRKSRKANLTAGAQYYQCYGHARYKRYREDNNQATRRTPNKREDPPAKRTFPNLRRNRDYEEFILKRRSPMKSKQRQDATSPRREGRDARH